MTVIDRQLMSRCKQYSGSIYGWNMTYGISLEREKQGLEKSGGTLSKDIGSSMSPVKFKAQIGANREATLLEYAKFMSEP